MRVKLLRLDSRSQGNQGRSIVKLRIRAEASRSRGLIEGFRDYLQRDARNVRGG